MWKQLLADSLKNIGTNVVKDIGQEIVRMAETIEQQRKTAATKPNYETDRTVPDILN